MLPDATRSREDPWLRPPPPEQPRGLDTLHEYPSHDDLVDIELQERERMEQMQEVGGLWVDALAADGAEVQEAMGNVSRSGRGTTAPLLAHYPARMMEQQIGLQQLEAPQRPGLVMAQRPGLVMI